MVNGAIAGTVSGGECRQAAFLCSADTPWQLWKARLVAERQDYVLQSLRGSSERQILSRSAKTT